MNLTEIKRQLDKIFAAPPKQGAVRSIVFWYDENGAFAEDIDTLDLADAKTIKLYDNNMFATKLYIEETDRLSNLLVYSPQPRPDNRDNWLTDTIRYSQVFSTTVITLHLLNLGLADSMRPVVERYVTFLGNKDRYKKFESYHVTDFTETKFDIAVLSVLCKLAAPNLDHVVRALLMELTNDETALIDSITKFGDPDALWALIRKAYGYRFEEQSLEKLAVMLFVTHLASSLGGKLPTAWECYVSQSTNCVVFIDNFMRNTEYFEAYRMLAGRVADKLGLENAVSSLAMEDMVDCDTFECFDCSIIRHICENINLNVDAEKYRRMINHRRNKCFFGRYEDEYIALLYACEFFMLTAKYKELSGVTPSELFGRYVNDYHKFDICYRKFILTSDKLESGGLLSEQDAFMELCIKIENTYTNWYLNELSVKWCALLDEEAPWQIPGVTPQQNFYDKNVRSFISENERMIVIISDGLRYESAVELTELLNAEQKGTAELSSMLGVIPSYTKLGMAALLPHQTIVMTEKADVLVDGISTQGTENRERILKRYKPEAVALTYESVMELAKQKGKLQEKFSGVKLIYLYHNAIDARGDNASTEREVFDATERCFAELSGLVRLLKNSISAINIYITADHGYLYKRTPIAESDKTPKELIESIDSNRRFFLSEERVQLQGTQTFHCSYLGGSNALYAVLPRATNCFKLQGGGSGYVHGGASLQEVAIPVIKFKSDKNAAKSMGAKKVSVSLTNLSRRITNVITHLSFFQNERVEEKVLPIRLKVYLVDEQGERISNENIIIAESASINPEERPYKEKFTLKNMTYDKVKAYYLVLEDEEEMVNKVYDRIPFTIDLVFGGIKF